MTDTTNAADVIEADDARVGRWSLFQIATGPFTVAAVVTWLALQQVSEIMDPSGLIAILIAIVALYAAQFVKVVILRHILIMNLISGMAVFVITFVGIAEVYLLVKTLREIERPCAQLKASFISKPDSNVSDAYQALHCTPSVWSHMF